MNIIIRLFVLFIEMNENKLQILLETLVANNY